MFLKLLKSFGLRRFVIKSLIGLEGSNSLLKAIQGPNIFNNTNKSCDQDWRLAVEMSSGVKWAGRLTKKSRLARGVV